MHAPPQDDIAPPIRQRMIDFLGGRTLDQSTCAFITHSDGCRFVPDQIRRPSDLDWFLERGLDIARSLQAREGLLLHLDVEYVNFDSPAEAYIDPWRIFELQEPVIDTIEELLLDWGIRPLHLITGQGHHFVWKIHRKSSVARDLSQLNPLPERTREFYAKSADNSATAVHPDTQDAFAGLALIMEHLAHQIKRFAAPKSEVPIEITAVHVGPAATKKREMISIDISEYGDPLHARVIRTPFSAYLKPWQSGLAANQSPGDYIPHFRSIRLQLENMLPHLLFGKTSDMLYMLGAINETDVGACLDTGHANLSGDISTVVHKLSGHLQMIHANDNLGDRDSHLPPGRGNIDWTSLIGKLEHYQFKGTIILELAGREDQNSAQLLEDARNARSFIQETARAIQLAS